MDGLAGHVARAFRMCSWSPTGHFSGGNENTIRQSFVWGLPDLHLRLRCLGAVRGELLEKALGVLLLGPEGDVPLHHRARHRLLARVGVKQQAHLRAWLGLFVFGGRYVMYGYTYGDMGRYTTAQALITSNHLLLERYTGRYGDTNRFRLRFRDSQRLRQQGARSRGKGTSQGH